MTAAPKSAELLACPFCDGEGLPHRVPCGWRVSCKNCDAKPRPGLPSKSEAEAIAAWNTRAAAQTPAAVEGWKLAPVEPTREMGDAGRDATGGYPYAPHDVPKLGYMQIGIIWSAMLSASPTPPAATVAESVTVREGVLTERQVRIAAWNAAKRSGASDQVGYAVVEAVIAELAAIRLLSEGSKA